MNWTTQCAVVIPCLNEAARIAEVVRSVRRFLPTVFVIDDGSQDDTGAMAKKAGAEVLRHEFPRGKGVALQTGWEHARKCGFRWALTMDGDGQHSANDVAKFFEAAERTGAELVVGNRMGNPKAMPRVAAVGEPLDEQKNFRAGGNFIAGFAMRLSFDEPGNVGKAAGGGGAF